MLIHLLSVDKRYKHYQPFYSQRLSEKEAFLHNPCASLWAWWISKEVEMENTWMECQQPEGHGTWSRRESSPVFSASCWKEQSSLPSRAKAQGLFLGLASHVTWRKPLYLLTPNSFLCKAGEIIPSGHISLHLEVWVQAGVIAPSLVPFLMRRP